MKGYMTMSPKTELDVSVQVNKLKKKDTTNIDNINYIDNRLE